MTKFGGPRKGGYFEVSGGLLLLLFLFLLLGCVAGRGGG